MEHQHRDLRLKTQQESSVDGVERARVPVERDKVGDVERTRVHGTVGRGLDFIPWGKEVLEELSSGVP